MDELATPIEREGCLHQDKQSEDIIVCINLTPVVGVRKGLLVGSGDLLSLGRGR